MVSTIRKRSARIDVFDFMMCLMAAGNVATGRETRRLGSRLTSSLHNVLPAKMEAALAITSNPLGSSTPIVAIYCVPPIYWS